MSFTHKRLNQNRHKIFGDNKNQLLAAAALLASCSQDDALQSTVLNNEGLKPMTITASLPSDGMQTRAAGDADAARCYVQILDKDGNPLADGNSVPIEMTPNGGTFSTLVYLNGNEIYDFLFWADTEKTNDDKSNAPADLKAVAYTNGHHRVGWKNRQQPLECGWRRNRFEACRFPCDRDDEI